MRSEADTLAETGLRFFGKISASISHELKNSLAIINENAGLLDDLTLMAEKGTPMNRDRLKKLAGSLMAQVVRADTIIKNMNRFAHSVDVSIRQIDLGEILTLMSALCGRFAAQREVSLHPLVPLEPVWITTHPFYLQELLCRIIEIGLSAVDQRKALNLIVEKTPQGGVIRIEGLQVQNQSPDIWQQTQNQALLRKLEAQLSADHAKGNLTLALPRQVSDGCFAHGSQA
jgi:C4-dicarboxylate-specific signal transduction histidine kinase